MQELGTLLLLFVVACLIRTYTRRRTSAVSTAKPDYALLKGRVVVVGGGAAGLAAALTLQQGLRQGSEIVLLESTERLGGRLRSDRTTDGFILDVGFAVFVESYVEARRWLDYGALRLHKFWAGAAVQLGHGCGGRHFILHPLKVPAYILRTIMAPIGSILDKFRLGLAFAVNGLCRSGDWPPAANFAGALFRWRTTAQRSTLDELRSWGFSQQFERCFWTPFLRGIHLAPLSKQGAYSLRSVLHHFCRGDVALPALGMGSVAAQLESRLRASNGERGIRITVRLSSAVQRVASARCFADAGKSDPDTQFGAGNRYATVELSSGEIITATAVVVATELPAAARILRDCVNVDSVKHRHVLHAARSGAPVPAHSLNSRCVYFAIDDGTLPIREPVLVLNGNAAKDDPSQPANSCAVLSRVCPSYAPAGKHLVSVSVVSEAAPQSTAALVTAVREQLAGWFGASARVDRWRLLRVYDVPHAQPPQHLAQPAPMPLRVASGVYCCGDHMDCPSLNGALRSGRLAAEAILDCKMTIDN